MSKIKEAQMRKSLMFSLIVSVAVIFTASSLAQPFQGVRRGHRGQRMMRRAPGGILMVLKAKQKELNITDDQLDKIKALMDSSAEKIVEMQNANNLVQLELKKLLQDKENLDYAKIKSTLSKASNNKHDMFIQRLKVRDEIGNLLTPEQRDALKEMGKDRMRGRRFSPRGERSQRFRRFHEPVKK